MANDLRQQGFETPEMAVGVLIIVSLLLFLLAVLSV